MASKDTHKSSHNPRDKPKKQDIQRVTDCYVQDIMLSLNSKMDTVKVNHAICGTYNSFECGRDRMDLSNFPEITSITITRSRKDIPKAAVNQAFLYYSKRARLICTSHMAGLI